MTADRAADLAQRITDYLSAGGLFNPEAMEHNKVRDLLIDCRDELARAGLDAAPARAAEPPQDVDAGEVESMARLLETYADMPQWQGRGLSLPRDLREAATMLRTMRQRRVHALIAAEPPQDAAEVESMARLLETYADMPQWQGRRLSLPRDLRDAATLLRTMRGAQVSARIAAEPPQDVAGIILRLHHHAALADGDLRADLREAAAALAALQARIAELEGRK